MHAAGSGSGATPERPRAGPALPSPDSRLVRSRGSDLCRREGRAGVPEGPRRRRAAPAQPLAAPRRLRSAPPYRWGTWLRRHFRRAFPDVPVHSSPRPPSRRRLEPCDGVPCSPQDGAAVTSTNTFACAGSRVGVGQIKLLAVSRCPSPCRLVQPCAALSQPSLRVRRPPSLLPGAGEGQAPPEPLLEDSVLALHACLALLMSAGSGKQRWAGEPQVWLLCSMAL